MASTQNPTLNDGSSKAERVMATNLQGLIDTCFEEGLYEAGLDMFEKVRSPNVYPAPYHVRVLLYLALYPQTAPQLTSVASTLLSPRKERLRKSMAPSRTATKRAIALLQTFACESTPSNLLLGLPAYGKSFVESGWRLDILPGSSGSEQNFIHDVSPSADENKIAQAALCVTSAKDIWACLGDGFIKRLDANENDPEDEILALKNLMKDGQPATPKKKRKPKKVEDEWDEQDDMARFDDAATPAAETTVAEQAWPVLDWFLNLFEKDEVRTESSGSYRYSPLLLSQLPVDSPRTNAEAPLRVAFLALTTMPYNQRRFNMGMRLINLLSGLTSPPPPQCLSPPQYLRQLNALLLKHTSDPNSDLPPDFLQSFLAAIPTSNSAFKLCLCCLYLASRSPGGNVTKFLGGPVVAGGRVGASPVKPKPIRRALRLDTGQSPGSSASLVSTVASTNPRSKPFPIPPVDDVINLLQLPPQNDWGSSKHHRELSPSQSAKDNRTVRTHINQRAAKLHVLSALATLQVFSGSSPEMSGWKEALESGRVRRAITRAFVPDEVPATVIQSAGADLATQLDALKSAADVFLEIWEAL